MQQAMQHAMSMSRDKRQRNAACKMQLRIANLSDAVWHAETSEYAMRDACAPVDEHNFAKQSDSLARGFPVNTTGWCPNVVRRLLQRSQRTEMHMVPSYLPAFWRSGCSTVLFTSIISAIMEFTCN